MRTSSERPWDRRPLVLIIDADDAARRLYGDWFWFEGFGVMWAVGVEGVSFALRRERPALIVTELVARDLRLADLMTRLASSDATRTIPVLVVTASCDTQALRAATTVGAVAVIPKLLDFDELRRWVRTLLPEVVPRPRPSPT